MQRQLAWAALSQAEPGASMALNVPQPQSTRFRGLHAMPEFPQIAVMHKHKHFPFGLLFLILGLAGNVSQAENVAATAGNIPSLSLAVSPLIPKAAKGEHNVLVASIDSIG